MKEHAITDWLPITAKEVEQHGWDALDVIVITGDAYVDHPAFGPAVIGRVLEHQGYRVALVPQPNWRDDLRDFKKMGQPRLFFGVTAGNMDSMVNHYTANKRLRSNDAYTPGGQAGFRPDYASVVYTRALKTLFPDVPVVLGGIEASMRRVTHYDYWADELKPSVLIDSGADMLIYGMGEKGIIELAKALDSGQRIDEITNLPQMAFVVKNKEAVLSEPRWDFVELASHDICLKNKRDFAANFRVIEEESNRMTGRAIIQACGDKYVVINPPYPPMNTLEIDASFDLPYTRLPHPKYKKRGVIPAYEMIRHSVNIHRGCFGGCSFCTISAHQGKFVVSRSEKSVLHELEKVTMMPDFKGTITDLGGPSANMYRMHGADLEQCKKCKRPSCIFPSVCANLNMDHKPLTALYRKALNVQGVKKIFIGSGIRYDMLVGRSEDENKRFGLNEYVSQVVSHHVSGRLKVAPEHTADSVLKLMRKPSYTLFGEFKRRFDEENQKAGLRQQLIPYFISSHPGCHLQDMAHLAIQTQHDGFKLEQVQDFTATPMTLATVIYYSGIHPYTLKPIWVARNKNEKLDQRRFFFWYKPENRGWIRASLKKVGMPQMADELLGVPPGRREEPVISHNKKRNFGKKRR